MSDEWNDKQVIQPELVKTKEETDRKCPDCGGTMDFDPGTGGLLCPYCGRQEEIGLPQEKQAAKELDFDSAEETGQLSESMILKQYEAQIAAYEPVKLTEEQIQEEFKVMDRYIYEFSHHPVGLEHHNLTPEEGLLMYIHMHPYE